MTEELKSGTQALAAFDYVDGALAKIKEEFAGRVYDVTTTVGMKAAKVDLAVIRNTRTNLERTRKEGKEPYLKLMKDWDAEAARLKAGLLEYEEPLKAQIRAQEEAKEAEKAEKIRVERERVAKHQERIAEIQQYPVQAIGQDSSGILAIIEELDAEDLSGMEEFQEAAEGVKRNARGLLVKALDMASMAELEAKSLAEDAEADRVRLEAENAEKQAKVDSVNAERQKQLDAQQAQIDADAKVAREAKEEADAKQAELDRQEDIRLEVEAKKAAAKARKEAAAKKAQERREAVLKARCATQADALVEIRKICKDATTGQQERLDAIEITCEANLEVE